MHKKMHNAFEITDLLSPKMYLKGCRGNFVEWAAT